MKKEIETNHYLDVLKRILCYSSTPQAIAVTEEMVDEILTDSSEMTLLSMSGDNLKDITRDFSYRDIKGTKAIILLRVKESHPLEMSYFAELTRLIDTFPENMKIFWGVATIKNQRNNTKLLIAIS